MSYVVLGMHKSGTTLVSQILHHSGINMVDESNEDITYDKGNKFERQTILSLNMELLAADDDQVRKLANPDTLTASVEQRKKMQTVIDDCNEKYEKWGFKDPRTVLTFPLWKNELGEHQIIAIYRRPEEIWPRFRWQGWRKKYLNPIWAYQYVSRWVEHNVNLIKYINDSQNDYLLLSYHSLMASDEEFNKLEMFTGISLTDTRKKELYRVKNPKKDYTLALASWLYKMINGYSYNEVMQDLAKLRETSAKRLANK